MINSIIICCIFYTITQFIFPSLQSIRSNKEKLTLHIALDLFVKEIRMCTIKQWKETTIDSIIWNNGKQDIGWRFNKNKLERIQGIYNTNGNWKKSKTSIIVLNINKIEFHFKYINQKIVGIESIITGNDGTQKSIHSFVAIRL